MTHVRIGVAVVLGGLVLAASALSCREQGCQVEIADPAQDPVKFARQSCWNLRQDTGECGDAGRPAMCEGMTLKCPVDYRLGEECPLFMRPDAGGRD